MYADRWSPRLRQGDVVGPISLPLLGKNFEVLANAQSLVGPLKNGVQKVLLPAAETLVVIISHDCEFNDGKRNKLLVARLQRVQGNLTDEQRQHLRDSNDVEARANMSLPVAGVDSFLLDPLPDVFDEGLVASFTTISPLPMNMSQELLGTKKAELVHEQRILFRKKLAWFVGRDAEDISDDEKTIPRALAGDLVGELDSQTPA